MKTSHSSNRRRNDSTRSSSSSAASPQKKARVGLPLELELAIPFLSATADLPAFAAVNKTFRDAARVSYQRRIHDDGNWKGEARSGTIFGKARIIMGNDARRCFLQPWWRTHDRNRFNNGPYPFEVYERELIVEDFGLFETSLMLADRYAELFDTIDSDNDETNVVHWSFMDEKLLLIINRWTNRGSVRIGYHARKTRQQLFAVVYNMSGQPHRNATFDGGAWSLMPESCHKLTKRVKRHTYGSLENVMFGYATPSRDGNVVAVITALPLGNIQRSGLGNPLPRDTAQITVFDVTDTKLVKRCVVEIPIGSQTNESRLTMALSNRGEMLSIYTTGNPNEREYGDWRVYDLVATDGEATVVLQKTRVKSPLDHYFTPDDELLVVLPQGYKNRKNKRVSVNEAVDSSKSFFHNVNVPAWLAIKMIVTFFDKPDDPDYNSDFEDTEDEDSTESEDEQIDATRNYRPADEFTHDENDDGDNGVVNPHFEEDYFAPDGLRWVNEHEFQE